MMFVIYWVLCFFFKQKTAYDMRISDWSSDLGSYDLAFYHHPAQESRPGRMCKRVSAAKAGVDHEHRGVAIVVDDRLKAERAARAGERGCNPFRKVLKLRQSAGHAFFDFACAHRSEERRVGKECVSTGRSRWSRSH